MSWTVIMTRANHFFMFLRSAHHVFLMHRQATMKKFLPHLCSWMMVKLFVNLVSICLRWVSNPTHRSLVAALATFSSGTDKRPRMFFSLVDAGGCW